MTLESWLAAITPIDLHVQLHTITPRKLHLLTAAFLRRKWYDLSCDHTRIAVEATEKFADGLLTADELARLRVTDLLESCEPLWLDPESGENLSELIEENSHAIYSVRMAIDRPAWMAVRAAVWAREIAAWAGRRSASDAAEHAEAVAQFRLIEEIVGPPVNPRWPEWRTLAVLDLARDIHRRQAFDQLPILADALDDAGCDDEVALNHCRAWMAHARGCWVVDLAMDARVRVAPVYENAPRRRPRGAGAFVPMNDQKPPPPPKSPLP